MKKCPYCAEEIQNEAIKCKHCGSMLINNPQEKWYHKSTTLIMAFLCIGPFMLPLIWSHPRLSPKAKIIITAIIIIVSFWLGALLVYSLKSITNYYKTISQGIL